MTRLTFVSPGRRLPARGLCDLTRPFLLRGPCFLVTLPTLQPAFLIACVAAASVLPITLGTWQDAGVPSQVPTVAVNEPDAELGESSLSLVVQVTVVTPIGKVEPDGWSHGTVGTLASSSTARGAV